MQGKHKKGRLKKKIEPLSGEEPPGNGATR
jgi:hypothetical protein